MAPSMEPSSPTDGGIRKRVCKACDRCRLKKSKCDGASPCSRCKADNAICFFGERKKSHDKVYPKGYVEMLESQQAQLVTGLQELYKRLQQGQGWSGAPLKDSSSGAPLTHDILDRIGALKHESGSGEQFEENLELLQQRIIASGAGSMQRGLSMDTSMDSAAQSPTVEGMSTNFINPFSGTAYPPTPPNQSPPPHTGNGSFSKQPAGFDVVQLTPYQTYTPEYLDDIDFMNYDPTSSMSMDPLMLATPGFQTHDAINPGLIMKDWDALQDPRQFRPNVFT